MGQLKALILWTGLFTLVFLSLGTVGLGYHALNQPLSLPAEEIIYQVPERSNLSLLASELKANHYLEDPGFLVLWARWKDRTLIQAGEYQLLQGDTALDLLDKLNQGQVMQHRVQLTEGWNFSELRRQLESDTRLLSDTRGLDEAELLDLLDMQTGYLEGWFFPDTYAVRRGFKVSDLLRRAHQRMQSILAEEWEARAIGLPYVSPEQALIMASIVEKETGLASEREAIAGVFVRRLQLGMRLQTDPTVIYGIKNFDGNLTRAHLREPTPYNTYVNFGLPPTPIAMPGRPALRAALHPEPGDALFFVARRDGSHEFSATLEAHEAAVRLYQLR